MPTAQQVVIRGVVVETDLPTSTCTTYTIVYKSGTITVDVHELISRWLNDVVEDIVAIYLVLPDPATQPVWVHVDEVEPRIGFERPEIADLDSCCLGASRKTGDGSWRHRYQQFVVVAAAENCLRDIVIVG